MSEEKQYEKAVGNLNKIKPGEKWEAELRLVGMDSRQRKDGSGSFTSWWALVRLISPFRGRNNEGDINYPFEVNDLVFTNITGLATKELKAIAEQHGHQYKDNRWRIPDGVQVILTYESKQAKEGGRYYHNLKARTH